MKREFEFEHLYEIAKKDFDFVIEWLAGFGFDPDEDYDFGDYIFLEDISEEERKDFDGCLYLGGYWRDFSPVIEFEDGHVVRWYRSSAWD